MKTLAFNRRIHAFDTTETVVERSAHLGLVVGLSVLCVGGAYFVVLYLITQ
jgi:hypothetical protein